MTEIIEEIKEMEHKKTEEALELVRKENDLWRHQSEKEEWIQKRTRKELGHHQEISRTDLIGKMRAVRKNRVEAGGRIEVREIIIVSDATWTLMAKGTASRQKQKFLEEKEMYQTKRMRR